ncbi:MAG: glycosyltransferase family 4 protein [Planctomycetes bacterium]|nr:glycosyltransferase family 4 protein [Planctomycetota bacterium]
MTREVHKLMFVSDAPHLGGAERYIAAMSGAARRRGIEPVVCWVRPHDAPADVFAGVERDGIAVRVVSAESARGIAAIRRQLRDLFCRERPGAAIVNASGRPRFWLTTWIARARHVPAAWVHQMVDGCDYRRLPPRRLSGRVEGLHLWRVPQALRHRLAAAGATAVVTLNEQDRDQVAREHGIRRRRIQVVPHGIDTDRYRFDAGTRERTRTAWSPLTRDATLSLLDASRPVACQGSNNRTPAGVTEPFIVGTAGRLVEGKGVGILIEAVAMLRRRGVSVTVVIAGEGPQRSALGRLAEELAVGDAVRFAGFVEDMAGFYCGLDVFALCSRTESFGLVLTEAMACERPVVATPTAGARCQIEDGHTGRLLPSFSAAALADGLDELFHRPDYREQLGQRARRHVLREFSIDGTLERTLQLLSPGRVFGAASDCRRRDTGSTALAGEGAA